MSSSRPGTQVPLTGRIYESQPYFVIESEMPCKWGGDHIRALVQKKPIASRFLFVLSSHNIYDGGHTKNMHLGELEKLVLQFLWDTESADAKHVFAYFEKRRGGSLNTIQSTLDRLFKKGLLLREKHGHAFHYQAAVDRDTFIGKLINEITSDFGSSGENTLLAAFTSLSSDLDETQLDELERLIDERRSKANLDTRI